MRATHVPENKEKYKIRPQSASEPSSCYKGGLCRSYIIGPNKFTIPPPREVSTA